MKLTILVDNNTYIDRYYFGEPALCCYVEDGDKKLLLDTGYSGVFLDNAKKLGIDLSQVTDIVLSHGHDDHTGGLRAFFEAFPETKVRVTAHPAAFAPKRDGSGLSIGSPVSAEETASRAELRLTAEAVQISEHVTFLGAIDRITDFEKKTVGFRLTECGWLEDSLPEDTALSLQVPEGQFLLLGCSHSGVCNIAEAAKRLFPARRITGLLGGMHLFDVDERTEKTRAYLENLQMGDIYPCHCTSFAVRAFLSRTLSVKEVGVGLSMEW